MTLGMDVGVGPDSHIVLVGEPTLPKGARAQTPNFRPMSVVTKPWMDQDTTW